MGIESKIAGRPKHFYSIWKKMHEGGREFDEIYDLTAVRVLTSSVRDCYGALGVIHSLWKPVPGRFKDFIAMPKVNMYQSLHTTVIGPKGDPVEIQIRTDEMHRIAEEGIAAHWLYKEKKSDRDKFDDAFTWLRQLLESQKDLNDPREFLDTVRLDLFPDEVYVFTPKGDVKALPEGSTPDRLRLRRPHRRGRPLRRARRSTASSCRCATRCGRATSSRSSRRPTQHPSRDWLKIVKSTRARSKINQWLKVEERERSLALGRELFEREAKKYRLSPTALIASEEMREAPRRARVPVSGRSAGVGRLRQNVRPADPGQAGAATVHEPDSGAEPQTKAPKKPEGAVKIRGVDDLLVRFAKCCSPVPGDGIVGFITRGRGLTVHARDCLTVVKNVLDKERFIAVEWDAAEADQAAGPHRRLHRQRPPRPPRPRSPARSPRGTATSRRRRSPSPRTGGASITSSSRSTISASCRRSCRRIREVRDVINVERIRNQ